MVERPYFYEGSIMVTDSKAFTTAVKAAAKVATERRVEILQCVKLDADGQTLTVTATNMEETVSVTIPCEGEIAALVNAKQLIAAIKGAKGPLTLTCNDSLTVGAFSLPLYPADDYPVLPQVGNIVATVEAVTFKDASEHTTPAASRDKSQPMLTATRLEIGGGTLRMVATDSYRMACTTREGSTGTLEANLPTRSVELAAKLLSGTITIHEAGTIGLHFALTDGTTTITTRILEGSYPDWQRLLPANGDTSVIPAEAFMQAVEIVKPACQRNSPMRVTFNPVTLTVHGETRYGPSATATVEGCDNPERQNTDGTPADPLTIGLNADFLADTAKILGATGEYRVSTLSPLRPITIRNGRDDCWYLMMPIRLAA